MFFPLWNLSSLKVLLNWTLFQGSIVLIQWHSLLSRKLDKRNRLGFNYKLFHILIYFSALKVIFPLFSGFHCLHREDSCHSYFAFISSCEGNISFFFFPRCFLSKRKVFFLSLVFRSFIMICLHVIFFIFILFGVFSISCLNILNQFWTFLLYHLSYLCLIFTLMFLL